MKELVVEEEEGKFSSTAEVPCFQPLLLSIKTVSSSSLASFLHFVLLV